MSTVRDLSGRAPSSRRKFRRLGVEERERVDDTAALLDGAEHDARDHSTALATAVLNDLSDVAGAPSADQVLTFDGTSWGPQSGASLTGEGFRAYKSVAQTGLAAGTFTKVTFDTQVFDEGADYDDLASEWTVPATGWYDVAARCAFSGLADGERAITSLYVNAAEHTRLTDVAQGAAASSGWGGTVPLKLTAGDVVTVYAYIGGGGDIGAGAALTYFTAKRRYLS